MKPKIYKIIKTDGCTFCKNCKGPFDGSEGAILKFIPINKSDEEMVDKLVANATHNETKHKIYNK